MNLNAIFQTVLEATWQGSLVILLVLLRQTGDPSMCAVFRRGLK